MEIVVTARHTEVSSRFRRILDEKLSKVVQYAPKAQRLEVGVSHETNKRQAGSCERIELTLHGKGPVVRAEACASDAQSALDLAVTKLVERLRRAGDRRKLHHGGRHQMASVRTGALPEPDSLPGAQLPTDVLSAVAERAAVADSAVPDSAASDSAGPDSTPAGAGVASEYVLGESPVVIRDKVHIGRPMTLDDALNEMELVGHDFFLFIDSATDCPSVVYRRRGWSYGVIRLAGDPEEAEAIGRAVIAAASPQASGAEDDGVAQPGKTPSGADAREPVTAG
jgi:ribosomal subunit interface protein